MVRLNKFLADCGVCSRRAADRMIEDGRVSIDGKIAILGDSVEEDSIVKVDGKSITDDGSVILLILNKPVGIECTTTDDKNSVVSFVNYYRRVYPIGRLDKDSEGLLLMTNRGDLVNGIMRSRYDHEKEYIVTVHKPITDKFLQGMANGVPILDTITKPCVVVRLGKYRFKIIITQGLNRQIRRMCQYFGYEVVGLKRIRILDIELGDLPVGEYRKASKNEINSIMKYAGMK